jgi:hypothetical protein
MLDFVNSVPIVTDEIAAIGSGAAVDLAVFEGSYLGSAVCKQCHASEFEQWQQTSHAHAFDTLVAGEHQLRSDCQVCHTTASGSAGGFVSREVTPDLAAVGCESCHGAGRAHVKNPQGHYGTVGLSSCTVCHDPKNSPKFDYYRYTTRVSHRAAR